MIEGRDFGESRPFLFVPLRSYFEMSKSSAFHLSRIACTDRHDSDVAKFSEEPAESMANEGFGAYYYLKKAIKEIRSPITPIAKEIKYLLRLEI